MANYSGGVPSGKSLVELNPLLADEWHPTRNGTLTAWGFGAQSKKLVWWLCTNGHEWQQSIATRTNGKRCPACPPPDLIEGSLRANRPELAQEWHPNLNGNLTPENTHSQSHIVVWWLCDNSHKWTASPHTRRSGKSGACPTCRSIGFLRPSLIPEWHPRLNADKTPETVYSGSDYIAWWACQACSFEWQATVSSRKCGAGCPKCGRSKTIAGRRRTTTGRSFGDLHPKEAATWHPTRNGAKTAFNVNPGSKDIFWWLCDFGHEYESRPLSRRHGSGCPYCSGKRVGYGNDFASKYPNIADQWHPSKNGAVQPSDVASNTHKLYWWQCELGHEWKTSPNGRVNRQAGCPGCVSKITSEQEKRLLAQLRLALPALAPRAILVEDWLAHCDMVDLDNCLVIEFDGSFWHRGKEGQDKAKANRLRNAGWTVVRVREFPLEPLHVDDVQVRRLPAYDAPVVAGAIVREHLARLLDLDSEDEAGSWLHEAGLGV